MGAHMCRSEVNFRCCSLGAPSCFYRRGLSLGSRACRFIWADWPEGCSNPVSASPRQGTNCAPHSVFVGAGVITLTMHILPTYLSSQSQFSDCLLIRLWLFNSLLSYFLDEKLKFRTSQIRGSWPESKPQFILNPCTRLPSRARHLHARDKAVCRCPQSVHRLRGSSLA